MHSVLLLLLISMSTFSVQSGEICPNSVNVGDALQWGESDFTKDLAEKNVKMLQSLVENKEGLDSCKLSNVTAYVKGYILKNEALNALKVDPEQKDKFTQYYVDGFCEFLKYEKPCE